MRLHGVITDLLGSPARVKVVRALVRAGSVGLTGREVARVASCSAPQAVQALRDLEGLGLVSRKVVGKAHHWTLVEEHVLVEPTRALFEVESDLPDRFRRDLRDDLKSLPVRSATLFGSIARGSETNESDADVYFELGNSADEEALQRALTPIVKRFIRRYGTVISPFIRTGGATLKVPIPGILRAIREQGIPLVPAQS